MKNPESPMPSSEPAPIPIAISIIEPWELFNRDRGAPIPGSITRWTIDEDYPEARVAIVQLERALEWEGTVAEYLACKARFVESSVDDIPNSASITCNCSGVNASFALGRDAFSFWKHGRGNLAVISEVRAVSKTSPSEPS